MVGRDERTDSYEITVVLIHFLKRKMGLLCAGSHPHGIKTGEFGQERTGKAVQSMEEGPVGQYAAKQAGVEARGEHRDGVERIDDAQSTVDVECRKKGGE